MGQWEWLRHFVLSGLLLVVATAPSRTFGASFSVWDVTELQAALTTAASNNEDDTITVNAGTYAVTTTLSYAPLGMENYALTINGDGAGITILDGGSATRILNIDATGAAANITLRGLTVRNGHSTEMGGGLRANIGDATLTIESAEFTGNSATNNGGAIAADSAAGTLILQSSTISLNRSGEDGGGVAFYSDSGTITISGNTFTSNDTTSLSGDDGGGASAVTNTGRITVSGNTFSGNAGADSGGGAFTYLEAAGGTVEITGNTFNGNTAGLDGGGSFTRSNAAGAFTVNISDNTFNNNAAGDAGGGGSKLHMQNGTATIADNTYVDNNTTTTPGEPDGAGLRVWFGTGSLTLTGNLFQGNDAGRNGGGADLATESGTITLSNNIFAANTANTVGGGVSLASATGTQAAMNNTFYGNSATDGGGINYYSTNGGTTLYVYNTILWNSTPQAIAEAGAGPVAATYSDIEGGTGQSWFGAGCIDQDPLLADPAHGDFHLQSGSPCIDAGDSNHDPALDFEGDDRWDDPARANTGVGPPWVDIGADERFPPDPSPPASPVKLIFIHHSTGENWLGDENGGLGLALRDNNYFVSDTNYGWGPDSIGDTTDIGHWWTWFRGPSSATYTAALYGEYGQHSAYTRLDTDPGGPNEIVMFKSCFPNSALQGNASDPVPPIGSNPLKGVGSGSEHHTVANAKGIYIDLLEYFSTRPDKLFVVITAPPLSDPTYAANARALNQWLVNDWLDGYTLKNVAVFDFYNVLTTNGGNANTNDLGQESGNHHRWWNDAIQHKTDGDDDGNPNVLEYRSSDDHPSRAGNLKATGEYPEMLNILYHCWQGTGGCPPRSTVPSTSSAVCSLTPRTGCAAADRSSVKVTDPGDANRRQLAWTWIGTATKGDFGNPVTGATSYALCLYDDGTPKMIPVVGAGGNWKETSKGYSYKNSATNADGIFKLSFKGGTGNAKILVKGKGANLDPPAPALPFEQSTGVTVQLVKNTESGTECWEAVFSPAALANDSTQFKDKMP